VSDTNPTPDDLGRLSPESLRKLADDPHRYGPVADALRWAATEIELLIQERDAARAELDRIRRILRNRGEYL